MKELILIKPFSHTLTDNIASALLLRPAQMVGFGFAAHDGENTAALLARRLPAMDFQLTSGTPETFRRLLLRLCPHARCAVDVTGAAPELIHTALEIAHTQPGLSIITCDSRTQTLQPLTPFPEAAHPRPWVSLSVDDFFTLCGVTRRSGGRADASPYAYRCLAECYDTHPTSSSLDKLARLVATLFTCTSPEDPPLFDDDILLNISKPPKKTLQPQAPMSSLAVPCLAQPDKELEDLDLTDERNELLQDADHLEILEGDIQRNPEKPIESPKETINAYLPDESPLKRVYAVAYLDPFAPSDIYFAQRSGKSAKETDDCYHVEQMMDVLSKLERHRLITNLEIQPHQTPPCLTISFRLPEKPLRNLLTNKGSFLEGKAYTAISTLKADRCPYSRRAVPIKPTPLRCLRSRLNTLRRPRKPAPAACFDNVVGNCCFCWSDPAGGKPVDNELDALMTHGLQLFVCSCKDTRQDKQHLYELSSIARQFNVNAIPLLVYSSEQEAGSASAVLARAASMGIAVAQARSTGQNSIRRTLYRLLPYRGRCKARSAPSPHSPRLAP